MKKAILAILFSMIFIASSYSVSAITIPEEFEVDQDLVDKHLKVTEDENFTGYYFASIGPKKLSYTSLKIDNGSLFNLTWLSLSIFETFLLRIMMWYKPLIRPVVFIVNDIDFTLSYKRDNVGRARNTYFTSFQYVEDGNYTGENTTIWNEKHTVKVEGFMGIIMLTKRSIQLGPTIMIIGGADDVKLVE